MNLTELSRVIESVGRDRGIRKDIIISAVEQAMLAAAQKKYGSHAILEAHYNDESGEVDLYLFKKVVESEPEMLEESEEINITEALDLDPQAQVGDELGVKVETPSFGRVDAQTAKQIIFQKVRDAERDIVLNEYMPLKGEIVSGIARRMERGNLVIDLGRTDALLPRNEIIPGEMYKPGDRVQALLTDVVTTTKGPALYISRTSPKYVMKLFANEVPEIRDGIIEIKSCAREPGSRAKIAVVSKVRDIDPVGACVGMKGVRVQQVIQELKGEKIDIIPWSENPMMFVRSALSPAEISSIRVDERGKMMEVMVEDSQLSLAIGKRGQNVRLAANISGWKLDIISKTKHQKRIQDAVANLVNIEGVSETVARALSQASIFNIKQLSDTAIEALIKVPGFDNKETAQVILDKAKALVASGASFVNGVSTAITMTETSNKDAVKDAANEKLKAMINESEAATEVEAAQNASAHSGQGDAQ